MAAEVYFYHLERAALDAVLPDLLEKTLARGWRAVVRVGDPDRVERLDAHLWTWREESFLPHGAGAVDDKAARQPIWLTAGDERPNQPQAVFLVEGARLAPEEVGDIERCVAIFDGRDADAVAAARAFWKDCAAAGHGVAYWRQHASGRWAKQN